MPAAEDRQARALEQIAQTNKEIVKVLSALNDNLVGAFKYIKAAIEKDEAEINQRQQQLDLDLSESGDPIEDKVRAAEYERSVAKRHEGEESQLCEGCGLLHCPDPECVAVRTPQEWMDHLKRWWNYESVGNTEELKLTKDEFFAYITRTNATEVTHQVPDRFKRGS